MKQKAFLLGMVFLLAACTPAPCVQYIECPDGDCKQQAQELCPHGYTQLRDVDVGPDFADFAKQHFAGAASGTPHINVVCNP